ncbi:MAG: tetratricopeptide repeat protein [Candidatus Eisenbacteria bacterium]
MRPQRLILTLGLLAITASSCAYYNTLYLARKYYFRATEGAPYPVDRQSGAQAQNFTRSIDYSKKVLGSYPKSKWVDDAYVLWARGLIGREDPLQTVTMLQDFPTRFPKSDLKPEAQFFLGLAYRLARKYPQAVGAFDDFLAQSPKHDLVPYAHYERSRALMSLQRYGEAATAAGQILERYPRSELIDRALRQRAEARFQQGEFLAARADYKLIGARATNDEERFLFLMREVDGLESARQYDEALTVLRSELSHTPPPPLPVPGELPPASSDRYGRISLRIGTSYLLAGRMNDALKQYAAVLKDYPKSQLGAEAQYRTGYAYETVGEDFDRARIEYAAVKEQLASSQFATQAMQRSQNLERIAQFRTAGGADSLERKAEASFLTAELYLFQLNRPERAREEYQKVAAENKGSAVAARAFTAEGWVRSRKLDDKRGADSLFWKVVREYPATESQLAARDYLEETGVMVPESLIQMPIPKVIAVAAIDSTALTPIPSDSLKLGRPLAPALSPADSALQARRRLFEERPLPPGFNRDSGRDPRVQPPPIVPAPRDTTRSAPSVPPGAVPDTTSRPPNNPPAPADTSGHRGVP